LNDDDKREVCRLQWELVPSWTAKLGKFPAPINAGADTVATTPTFRRALKRRRCVVPVEGFYEWRRSGGPKQPFRIAAGEILETCAIMTTEANELVGTIHDRMPVILDDAELRLGCRATCMRRRSSCVRSTPRA